MPKFKVGDRVKRNLDVGLTNEFTHGVILSVVDGFDNNNRPKQAYRVGFDCFKKGKINYFTNEIEPDKGIIFLEVELEKE